MIASARDITASVNPPRTIFVDYPLGHQTGLAGNPDSQRAILREALEVLVDAREPGAIVDLPLQWHEEFDYVANPGSATDGG